MTSRGRTLAVGGGLLALLVVGLIVGFIALSDSDGSLGSTDKDPTDSPTGSPTDTRVEVEQAYLNAWDVWADALLTLDTSHLSEAFTGRALMLISDQVTEQRLSNQPVQVRAEHNYTITVLNQETASVDDRYINHNVRVDPETLEPIEADPNRREHRSFTLKLVDDTWKIERIIEYE